MPDEWASAENSPLMPWIVPIVSNPEVPSSAASRAMRGGRGKIPSVKNERGEAVGIKNWTNRGGNKNLSAWSEDPDYGFGVRLGRGGLVAIDCDCDDRDISEDILDMLHSATGGTMPLRRRGTARWACILRLKGRECVSKRKYALPIGILEILGDGQQLACAGTHPGGARYEWEGGAVGDVREIDLKDLDAFCDTVETLYGGASPVKPRVIGETYAAKDRLADWLRADGRVKSEGREGELYIECPWAHTHGEKDGETSTVYFPVGSNGHDSGGFKCLHAHCASRGMADFVKVCKTLGYTETSPSDYPDMTTDAPEQKAVVKTTAQALMEFRNEKSGKIDPCMQSLELALRDPSFCGYEFAYDTFAAGETVRKTDGEWTPYQDALSTEMRLTLERLGFRTPKKQDVTDLIKAIAARNKFDSMADYLAANIPPWDGTCRVSTFFHTYCGAELSEWTIEVSLYLFTALWARASSPDGCKADIAPVLIGKQGTGKSTLTRLLALNEDWCADVDFTEKDADIARELRQKIVMEIPELGGMSKREQNGVKAFMTRKKDSWVPKFVEAARIAARRCVFIVTTNDRDFLTDHTGNRRWAPVEVGRIDRDALTKDMPQLWAEAREIFKAHGVMYEGVERLQDEINQKYVAADPWQELISEWIATNPEELMTTKNIVEKALRQNYSNMKRRDANAVAGVMRGLGYESTTKRIDGIVVRVWV